MKNRVTTLLAVALALGTTYAFDIHTLLNADTPVDVNAKPCQLTQAQLEGLLAPPPATAQPTENAEKYILISSALPVAFAEAAAQQLTPIGYQVCQSELTQLLPGEVTIIRALSSGVQPIVYYGKRNAETLALFVQKLDARYSAVGPAFTTITSKMERKAFERLQGAKVIAFYPDPTADPDFVAFQQAARQLAPNPPFYVVHDTHFARKLKLTEPGQIALLHRAEKSIVYFSRETPAPEVAETAAPPAPATSVTAAEIAAWAAKHRGYILHELDDTNLYDPEVLDPSKYLFAAVADQTSPLGLYFHKMLTKAIQNISRENEIRANLSAAAVDQTTHLPNSRAVQPEPLKPIPLDDIEIIWIDLQKYPLAAQKIAQNLNLNTAASSANNKNKDVHFGLVQVPREVLTNAQANQWFDVSQLASTLTNNVTPEGEPKRSTEKANIQLLRDWILTVTDRLPKPIPVADAPVDSAATPEATTTIEILQQDFALEPEPVSVRAGGSFVLDCRVNNKAGQCGWSKDGEAVDVETEAAYQWANEEDIYDCSLAVSGADATRDGGDWSCSVTEAAMDDGTVVVAAIESSPVTVSVRVPPQQKTKKTTNKAAGKTATKKSSRTVKSEL